jgi:hypothetical protein
VRTHLYRTRIAAPATLAAHNALELAERGGDGESAVFAFLSNPYFIGIAGALLWLALIVLIMVLWYNKWRRGKKNGGITGLSPFIKINDGSVLNRDPLWIDSQLNTAQRNLLMNGHITGNGECTSIARAGVWGCVCRHVWLWQSTGHLQPTMHGSTTCRRTATFIP